MGGLGKYAEETSMIFPGTWSEGEGFTTLELPPATVMADFVRLSEPRQGDMPIPPQWLGPDTKVEMPESTFVIIAERPRRGVHPVLHFTVGDQVLHLEPDPADSSFDKALRAATEAP